MEQTDPIAEDFLDRMRRQTGWHLNRLNGLPLGICAGSPGVVHTLGLAAVSSGALDLTFVAPRAHRDVNEAAAEAVMNHLGTRCRHMPVLSPGFMKIRAHRNLQEFIWIMDAGDPAYDAIQLQDSTAFYFAECRAGIGSDFMAIGTDRDSVARYRKKCPAGDRAEISALCAQLLIGVMAEAGVCDQLVPHPPFCVMSLTRLPKKSALKSRATLYAGGGGAIAHQVMWAESLDPILKNANRNGRIIVVDPKRVHESCRSRQWAYGPEDLHEHKADCTQKWLRRLFPGADVVACNETLDGERFQEQEPEEVISSVDNWSARKSISRLAIEHRIPWYSTGSSFLGGFARCVDDANPICAPAETGTERLAERPDDGDRQSTTSCSAEDTPMPSSVLPQMILGSFVACQRRAVILGTADPKLLARGIEVHMAYGSIQPFYKDLRWGPGRLLNLRRKIRKAG